jgi:hypothetical protein
MAIANSTRNRGDLDIASEVGRMQRMTAGQLRDKYAEVLGEPARSSNKTWLIRRIAWRMQADAEGDLTERARRRLADELANDADVRVTPPKKSPKLERRPVVAHTGDKRLPPCGGAITHKYKGRLLMVTVEKDGFSYEGKRFKSLSAVAKAISGSHCNGFRFFGLRSGK